VAPKAARPARLGRALNSCGPMARGGCYVLVAWAGAARLGLCPSQNSVRTGRIDDLSQRLPPPPARCSVISALRVAEVYAHRGDRDRAFEWLDRAVAQRDKGILGVRWDPDLRGLHGDPRWAALLKKLNLPLD
jgi:hypothetical protein